MTTRHRVLQSLRKLRIRPGLALLTVLGAAGLALSTPAPAFADELRDLARDAAGAVVQLKIYGSTGRELGQGTGFFVGPGRMVTNHHVIQPASRVEAVLPDGTRAEVRGILAQDEDHDLAFLDVALEGHPVLKLSGREVETGDDIVVLGNPLGLAGTLSTGIVAAVRSEGLESGVDGPLLQITAAISPGSSGSPVMNLDGEVVAVAVAQYVMGQNLNFAVPVSEVRRLEGQITAGEPIATYGDGATFAYLAYARNVGLSLLFFAALAYGFRRLR